MNMTKAIYFDMDGTIADLYGVEGWLNDLESENERPYATAKPLIRMSALAKVLNRLQRNGYTIGIVSWLSKNGTPRFNEAVTEAKKEWLKQRFEEGLVFYRSGERGKCFIEYIPAENAWVPIDADGYMYIDCLW